LTEEPRHTLVSGLLVSSTENLPLLALRHLAQLLHVHLPELQGLAQSLKIGSLQVFND